MFRQALTRMFEAREADAIFFETSMHLKRFPHMALECVPLSISAGETAPIYFKVRTILNYMCIVNLMTNQLNP